MTDEALELSALLAAELADNESLARDEIEAEQAAPRMVDTRTIPARFHHLAAMGRCPAHGRAAFSSKYSPDSLAMRIGAGTHAMLFNQPHVLWDGGQRRKGTAKKASLWDLFVADHAGKVILNKREWSQAEAMCKAIRDHAIANRLLFSPGVVHEETILFEQDGRARRSTPDARGTYHLVELKTTRNAEPRAFTRDAGYRAYAAQLADQACAVEAVTGVKPREVYVVAVESAYPYVVQCFQLTDMALERGRVLARSWLDRLLLAEETGIWSGYSERIEALEPWADVEHDADDDDENVFTEVA